MEAYANLASYRRCVERIGVNWSAFQVRRMERLRERERFGHAAERATESILEDLFTGVLDWSLGDVNHQVGYADLLLSSLGVKHLIVEAKRPGALSWNRAAINAALDQACRYAAEQNVRNVAVSDGRMLYAAEVVHGGRCGRCFVALDADEAPGDELFWLSVHGIYRPAAERDVSVEEALPRDSDESPATEVSGEAVEQLLHPKYGLPASCFAYVGDAAQTKTWRLPYLFADGRVDTRRLSGAVRSILSNYRGARVGGIPETDIPDVLVRLACAAAAAGKMPDQSADAAPTYRQLADALVQMDRLGDVKPLFELDGKAGVDGPDPNAAGIAEALDRSPGAWERTQEGLAQAARDEGTPLDELT